MVLSSIVVAVVAGQLLTPPSHLQPAPEAGGITQDQSAPAISLVVERLEDGIVVDDVSSRVDPRTGEITIGARVSTSRLTASADELASRTGAHWPSWSSSRHSSVRIKVYVNFRKPLGRQYVGDAIFQTYQRKKANDGQPRVDYWQVSRHAIARPSNTKLLSTRVKTLWASQRLSAASAKKAREWMWKLTEPLEGFSECDDGAEVSIGPFAVLPKDCSEYDVWTGATGHQRVSLDQGFLVSGSGHLRICLDSRWLRAPFPWWPGTNSSLSRSATRSSPTQR